MKSLVFASFAEKEPPTDVDIIIVDTNNYEFNMFNGGVEKRKGRFFVEDEDGRISFYVDNNVLDKYFWTLAKFSEASKEELGIIHQ